MHVRIELTPDQPFGEYAYVYLCNLADPLTSCAPRPTATRGRIAPRHGFGSSSLRATPRAERDETRPNSPAYASASWQDDWTGRGSNLAQLIIGHRPLLDTGVIGAGACCYSPRGCLMYTAMRPRGPFDPSASQTLPPAPVGLNALWRRGPPGQPLRTGSRPDEVASRLECLSKCTRARGGI